eukprot:gene10826-22579_t
MANKFSHIHPGLPYVLNRQNQKQQPMSTENNEHSYWENPKVIGKNRRPPHTLLRAFKNYSTAMLNFKKYMYLQSKPDSDSVFFLTGASGDSSNSPSWKFTLIGSPIDSPKSWQKKQFDDSSWNNVKLPAHWQLQGYDIPIYTNTSYPFRFDPPNVQRDGQWTVTLCDGGIGGTTANSGRLSPKEPGPNATGLFRRTFTLPSVWDIKSDRIFIIFEGVDSCVEVWLNDEYIGYSQDSCLPAEFEITEALARMTSSVQHVLAVKVMRWCDGSYLEDQDKWWLSGIYREVYLLRKPSRMICDFEVTTDLTWTKEQECSSALVTVDVLIEGDFIQENWTNAYGSIHMEIWQPGNEEEPVASLTKELSPSACLPGREAADKLVDPYQSDIDVAKLKNPAGVRFQHTLQKPMLWTAETPKLYYVIISLHKNFNDAKLRRESAIDIEACLFGVREVGTYGLDNSFCVNKVPIVIAGVNRHEFDNFSGRAVSKKTMCHDMTLLKKMHFNAVRNSHYPPHPYWHELCDTAGMYVVDEANIETHGFQVFGQPVGYLANCTEWKGAFINRVVRMYERDKNNPSIILWSLGNESGVGAAHFDMYKWLKARDPRRLVQYESGGSLSDVTDIICPMYRRPMWCVEQSKQDARQRPVILCEYAHMMGNSGGCMDKYWEQIRDQQLPRMQGGFIWDFIDQGLNLPEGGFGYGGDFGDLPNTKQFCCNGLFGPDRMPHPSAFEAAALQCPVYLDIESEEGSNEDLWLTIKNLRQFRDLSDMKIEILIRCDAQAVGAFSASVTFECGQIRPFTIGRRCLLEIFPTMHQGSSSLTQATGLSADVIGTVREIWIELAAVMLGGDDWLPFGHDIIRRSITHKILTSTLLGDVNHSVPPVLPVPKIATMNMTKHNDLFVIAWTGGHHGGAVVGAKCGRLLSWVVRNSFGETVSVLAAPLDICVWRASTDNDRGGSAFSYHERWMAAGLPRMERDPTSVSVEVVDVSKIQHRGPPSQKVMVSLKCSWVLRSPKDALTSHKISCTAKYDFRVDGSISVSQTISPSSNLPPLPRVGVRTAVPKSFAYVEWLGLGAHEAYDDRKSSVRLGRFSAQVDDLHTPYVVPQECGRRAEPRWVALREGASGIGLLMLPAVVLVDAKGRGVGIDAKGWGWSASRFTTEMLHECLHEHELQADKDKIDVHLDSRMMGIGGYDSWTPNVDDEYLVESTSKSFTTNFILVPILEQENLHELLYGISVIHILRGQSLFLECAQNKISIKVLIIITKVLFHTLLECFH